MMTATTRTTRAAEPDRYACLDRLETCALRLGGAGRWEIRGSEAVLCLRFGGRRLEAIPRGGVCDLRLVGFEPEALLAVAVALKGEELAAASDEAASQVSSMAAALARLSARAMEAMPAPGERPQLVLPAGAPAASPR